MGFYISHTMVVYRFSLTQISKDLRHLNFSVQIFLTVILSLMSELRVNVPKTWSIVFEVLLADLACSTQIKPLPIGKIDSYQTRLVLYLKNDTLREKVASFLEPKIMANKRSFFIRDILEIEDSGSICPRFSRNPTHTFVSSEFYIS